MAILRNINELTREELIAALLASQAASAGKLTPKVSAKGAVSLYGFGKWPVTLYASQWEKLFAATDQIKSFIEANQALLTVKAKAEA